MAKIDEAVRNVAKRSLALAKSVSKSRTGTNRAKLLISIVNRGDDEALSEILNDFSVALTFSCMGMGTARAAVLRYLGIGTSEKDIMISLIPESDEDAILNEIRMKMSLHLVGRGIAFTVPLSAISEIVANGLVSAAALKTVNRRKTMKDKDRNYDLIVAAVAEGYVDDAMEAARRAGAAGGTILRARSINNEKVEQFVGISINEECELLLIVAQRDEKISIMNALSESVGLKSDAGGILFSVPIDKTVGIGAVSSFGTAPAEKEKENTSSENSQGESKDK